VLVPSVGTHALPEHRTGSHPWSHWTARHWRSKLWIPWPSWAHRYEPGLLLVQVVSGRDDEALAAARRHLLRIAIRLRSRLPTLIFTRAERDDDPAATITVAVFGLNLRGRKGPGTSPATGQQLAPLAPR
jgi:hypothetical protein